jgi:hypothetical protein
MNKSQFWKKMTLLFLMLFFGGIGVLIFGVILTLEIFYFIGLILIVCGMVGFMFSFRKIPYD